MTTEDKLRTKIMDIANFYAVNETYEWNDRLNELIEVYNTHKPLTRNIKYSKDMNPNGWCALFVSAVYILAGLSDLIVTEIGAWEFKDNAKKCGEWKSRESGYIPKRGDIVVYSWDAVKDSKKYTQYHVGIITNSDASINYSTEGNVASRVMMIATPPNDKRIEGYWAVNFEEYAAKLEREMILPVIPKKAGVYDLRCEVMEDGKSEVYWNPVR